MKPILLLSLIISLLLVVPFLVGEEVFGVSYFLYLVDEKNGKIFVEPNQKELVIEVITNISFPNVYWEDVSHKQEKIGVIKNGKFTLDLTEKNMKVGGVITVGKIKAFVMEKEILNITQSIEDTSITNNDIITETNNIETINYMLKINNVTYKDNKIKINMINFNDYSNTFKVHYRVLDYNGVYTNWKFVTNVLVPYSTGDTGFQWKTESYGTFVIEAKITKDGETISTYKETIVKDEPIFQEIQPLEMPSFIDQTKDPSYYVNRYNNESIYSTWFDKYYSDYNSIYEAVGLCR